MSLHSPPAIAGQVGVLDERAAVVAEQLLALHRHDEQPSVGQPAEARGLVVEVGVHGACACRPA